jgi:hypothetical protein
MSTHPSSATHVVFRALTADTIARLGATNVVRACDCLLIGPSRSDPEEHAAARRVWWQSDEQWDLLYAPDVLWKPPVIVWASAHIADRLNMSRALSWLCHMGLKTHDVSVVELPALPSPTTPEEPLPAFNCTASVADHAEDVLLDHFHKARPWPVERYDATVRLWEMYVDRNPLPFARTCMTVPDLSPLWLFLSHLFPREQARALLLSRLDELILTILCHEWQTPVAVFVHRSQAGLALRQLLCCTGDLFLPQRLDDWTRAGAADRAPGPRPPLGYPMNSSVYRLTEKGRRLREEGLERLTDAPALPIGGTAAYGEPWVLLEDGRLARGT